MIDDIRDCEALQCASSHKAPKLCQCLCYCNCPCNCNCSCNCNCVRATPGDVSITIPPDVQGPYDTLSSSPEVDSLVSVDTGNRSSGEPSNLGSEQYWMA